MSKAILHSPFICGIGQSLYSTKAVIILDSEGKRLLSKYYTNDYPTPSDQRTFEGALYQKTKKQNAEIILFENHIVLYRTSVDVTIYVIGYLDENELILSSLLSTLYQVFSNLLGGQIEKSLLLQSMDLIFLALDETIDNGIIRDLDPDDIISRVSKPDAEKPAETLGQLVSGNVSEQTLRNVFRQLDEQFGFRLGA
ncbi:Coatomer subunit zeta-1 [Rhizophlyctis rosea]|uniref:Coatomer subunit zeta n=1 Tax=Rhizophlyctis rosea TaxID=64517 RepID=A0AAD5X471_9FUNG|nr:Coatomer subunit zeta-1 [Rhizophlyctis rosea]